MKPSLLITLLIIGCASTVQLTSADKNSPTQPATVPRQTSQGSIASTVVVSQQSDDSNASSLAYVDEGQVTPAQLTRRISTPPKILRKKTRSERLECTPDGCRIESCVRHTQLFGSPSPQRDMHSGKISAELLLIEVTNIIDTRLHGDPLRPVADLLALKPALTTMLELAYAKKLETPELIAELENFRTSLNRTEDSWGLDAENKYERDYAQEKAKIEQLTKTLNAILDGTEHTQVESEDRKQKELRE